MDAADSKRLGERVGPGDYHAPGWLPGGHAQTIYASLFAPAPGVDYRRAEWETPDGDFIELDWVDGPADAPLVVLFHGLEGGSGSHYALSLMHHVRERGWRGVIPHFRGCGSRPNRLPRAYHSGDFEELDWVLGRLAAQAGPAARFAVGVSLGGNALLKWLAVQGGGAAQVLRAAAAVSAPMDLRAAGHGLGRGFNRLYTWQFLRTLKPKSLEKLARHPGLYDGDWTRASSKPDLRSIQLPTLLLHARNDPFLPGRFLPAADEVSTSVTLEYPDTGGHVAFVTGPFPGRLDWLPRRLLAFFEREAAPHGLRTNMG
jgi:uncharacterized protein